MTQLHHHSGLTDSQVLASRQAHGANVLTPRKKSGFWEQVRKACTHGIAYTLYVLTAACIAAAGYLTADMGAGIWVMPLVIAVATAMILVVGTFGGFKEPLMRVLIAAFVLSIGISIYEYECDGTGLDTFFEPIGIIAALLLATGVAFFLERANEKTFQSLNEVNDDTPVKVVRNGGNTVEVPRRDVVVGDIVLLEAGEEVPADCRLLESLNLSVDESSLTGEPECSKTTNPDDFNPEATYPPNEIFKGTIVLEGYCTAEVTKVGDATECGRVFEAAQVSEGSPTPLSEKLSKLATLITRASYIVGILVIVGRLTVHAATGQIDLSSTEGWIDLCTFVLNTVMIAVTLIVVSVPEGLPMSVTMSLALSMRKLMRENTLPRTMHACETMGAASVICTDKTGTLTQNRMQVAEAQIRCDNADLVAEMIAFNTTANLDRSDREQIAAVGNPTEGALLLWLDNEGVDYQVVREQAQIIDRLPFSTENKYMASIVQSPALGGRAVMVKGAPEIILAMTALSADEKEAIAEQLLVYQSKAMRTLAIAYAKIDDTAEPFLDGKLNVNGLTLGGIFAISDPVRREVPAAIRDCISAGIQVKIVTGDTPGTAKEIGRQIGLWTDADTDRNILTGTEFAALSDEEVASRVMDMKIMSRARPNDKERLVRALRAQGMVVAVTGDGTNDAPALNAADVGLSMGDGTAVAKEASDMTIQDNSFSTITNAVMWGRSLYKNIQRFIMFQMTINVVACLVVLIGAFIGTESPLTVTQMLWVNLIMDTFAAIALASLPPSHSVMAEKPRRVTDSIISRAMAWNILGVGGLFTAVMLAVLLIMQHADITGIWQIASGQFTLGQYDGLTALELSEFFTLFVMLQFWNMFNAKAFMTGKSALSNLRHCRSFLGVAAVIFFGQILLVEFGGRMFNVTPFCLGDWLVIILGTSPVLIIGEIIRLVGRRKASQRL